MIPDPADAQMLLRLIKDHADQAAAHFVMDRFLRQQAATPQLVTAGEGVLGRIGDGAAVGSGDGERAAMLQAANQHRDAALKAGMQMLAHAQRFANMTYGKQGDSP